MKYKLKTRLFAALALSGASFYWPASGVLAQEGDFGFIRPAEPTRQNEQELGVPPIAQVRPPIISGAANSGLLKPNPGQPPIIVQAPNARAGASAPMAFATSNVFNGAYVESVDSGTGSVGYAQHVSPAQAAEQASSRQVAYNDPTGVAHQAPTGSGIRAQRDVPPIVESPMSSTRRVSPPSTARRVLPRIVRPIEQNELPPILSTSQAATDPGVPPIVAPKPGLDQLLHPIPAKVNEVVDGGMVQDQFLLDDDGAEVRPAAAFGASPLLIQDAPPIIGGFDSVAMPSSDGVLLPADPAVDVPLGGLPDTFPRATPLDSANTAPRTVLDNGPIAQPETQPRPTYFEPGVQQSVAAGGPAGGGCSTCGTAGGSCGCNGGGVSGCSSCGENGCFDPAAVESMFNTSGSNAYARRYVIAEALYLDRGDGTISNSNFGTLNNFDASGGARITVGRREDSTRGREFQYSGIDTLDETIQTTSPAGLANAQFVPFGGFGAANLQSFFNATEQTQTAETSFHSLEFNKVKWGWDVIKSYIGLRYLYVDDEYTILSQSGGTPDGFGGFTNIEQGEFQLSTANHLIGPQIGGELYYDVGYRWSLSGVSRAGLYANFNEVDTSLVNDGSQFINSEDTNATVSFSYEIGLTAKYRMTQQSQFRVGYNLYFWDNLATTSDNLDNQGAGIGISPSFGTSTSDSDSLFLHGLSFGFEVYR